MLHLAQLQEINARLIGVSRIVDLQESRSVSFIEEVLKWLRVIEKDLEKAQLQVVSRITALRSKLLATMHRCEAKDGVSRRKQLELVASNALQDAQAIVQDAIAPKLAKLEEAREIASRVVSVAFTKGYFDQFPKNADHMTKLHQLQSVLKQDPDTMSAITHLTGIVGMFDTIVILDQATSGYDL